MELVSRWSHGRSWTDLEKSSTEDTSASSMVNGSDSVKLWGEKRLRLHCSLWYPVDFHGYALIQNPGISEEVSIYRWCPDVRRTTELSLLNVKLFTSCHLFTQRHLLLRPQKAFRNLGF